MVQQPGRRKFPQISVYLGEGLDAAVEAFAKQRGTSRAQAIRDLLTTALVAIGHLPSPQAAS